MDKKLMIKIEEYLNNLPQRNAVQKVDPDIHAALEEAIKNRTDVVSKESLYDFLCNQLRRQHFVKKSGLLDEAGFYTYAQISSNTWSNIRWGNGNPSKETLLKLIIALKMDEDDVDDVSDEPVNVVQHMTEMMEYAITSDDKSGEDSSDGLLDDVDGAEEVTVDIKTTEDDGVEANVSVAKSDPIVIDSDTDFVVRRR